MRGKNQIERTCQTCGKKFYVIPHIIKTNRGKFCSYKCRYIWMSKNQKGKNSPAWRGGKIKRVCQLCNKEFGIFPSRIKYNYGKFCSPRCYYIWGSENRRGKNGYNWKGGITPLASKIRNSEKYLKWRSDIFIRDNFTCQKCKIKGNRLEAHHIKSFSKLIQEVKKYLPLLSLYEGAMIYTPLWDLDNGITLCEKCHKKVVKQK